MTTQKRTIVINEATSKSMPLELAPLGIQEEWNYVIGQSVDDAVEMKAFGQKMMCCMFATVCFLFCTAPYMIYKGAAMEREFLAKLAQRYELVFFIFCMNDSFRCIEANARPHMQGRVQFSSGKEMIQTLHNSADSHGGVRVGNSPVYFVTVEWNDGQQHYPMQPQAPPSYASYK